ncbi:MAG: D-alanyl-D-alanine carboxypeptidase [Chloroflexota bacterium]|nr:MAG: D-alanyl-D-alanine carboxypeptidase [Chloroflexota bacterium]
MNRLALLVVAVCAPWLMAFAPPAFVDGTGGRSSASARVLNEARLAGTGPTIAARAAITLDVETGQTLFQREADRELPIASTTKLMTALVAVERVNLDQRVAASVAAADLPGHSVAGLVRGDALPMREMLYGLLLPSGNDAALSIAQSVSGGVEPFVRLMNERAQGLGLAHTRFTNPHGFDAAGHYGSARDLARLAAKVLEQPFLRDVVATKEHVARGQETYRWTNLNRMLWLRADATGLKTGTTDAAGPSLVASADRAGRTVIAVLLNSPDRWSEAEALLAHGFSDFTIIGDRISSPFFRDVAIDRSTRLTVPAWQARLWRLEPIVESSGRVTGFRLAPG